MANMKITIDKHYTALDQVKRTREHIAEFKQIATPESLIDALRLELDRDGQQGYVLTAHDNKILSCELSAFPGGTMEEDTTHYAVEIVAAWHYDGFVRMRFYISQNWNVRLRAWSGSELGWMDLYKITRYTPEGE